MSSRFICSVLACLTLGLIAGQVWAQDGAKLEYKFTLGELLRYKVSEKFSYDSDSPMVIEGILRLRVAKLLQNGDAEIRAAYEKGTLRYAGKTKDISADSVAPIIFQVSKNGVIRDAKTVLKNAGHVEISKTTQTGTGHSRESMGTYVYSTLTSIFREYPDRKLNIGETWEEPSDSLGISSSPKAVTKLVSIDTKAGGTPIAIIVTTGDETGNPKTNSTDGSAAGSMTMRVVQNTKASFAIEKGCVAAADDKVVITMSSPSRSSANLTMTAQVSLLPEENSK